MAWLRVCGLLSIKKQPDDKFENLRWDRVCQGTASYYISGEGEGANLILALLRTTSIRDGYIGLIPFLREALPLLPANITSLRFLCLWQSTAYEGCVKQSRYTTL